MQEPKTALSVVKRLQKNVLESIADAKKELRSFWKHVEAQGKIKALQDVYRELVLLELSFQEDAERRRRMVDAYGDPVQEPHLIDL